MRTTINGVFHGTGAAVYLCLGAVPESVEVINLENTTNPLELYWEREYTKYSGSYGGLLVDNAGTYTYATSAGVFPYEGGEVVTTANQASSAYAGAATYLRMDYTDYRKDKNFGTAGLDINAWTQYSTNTGHWNNAIVSTGARIGVQSIIRIKEQGSGLIKEAVITALTGTGESTNNVTLSRTIGSGNIVYIGGIWSMVPVEIGKVTSAGVCIADTTTANASGKAAAFKVEIDTERGVRFAS